jgi:hypothetical protein
VLDPFTADCKKVTEGPADCAFMFKMELAVLVECVVVRLDRGVVRLEGKRHRGRGSLQRICRFP